jgi:hypothetical protein
VATDDQDEPGPRADDDAVVDPSPSGVATTAARALVLGAALTGSGALLGIEQDLPEVGIDRVPPYWGGWEERQVLFGLPVVMEQERTLSRFPEAA